MALTEITQKDALLTSSGHHVGENFLEILKEPGDVLLIVMIRKLTRGHNLNSSGSMRTGENMGFISVTVVLLKVITSNQLMSKVARQAPRQE